MPVLHHSLVTLRFFGDELNPDEITALLGASPTAAHHKGQQLTGSQPGAVRLLFSFCGAAAFQLAYGLFQRVQPRGHQ